MPAVPFVSPGSGRFIVGGLYDPRFASGLPGPPGAPIRLVFSTEGFTKLLPPLPAFPPGLLPVNPVAAPPEVGPDDWLAGGTCCPFRATGFDDVWSMPGVLRMEGLSALGSNTCLFCGGAAVFWLASVWIDLAEKNVTGPPWSPGVCPAGWLLGCWLGGCIGGRPCA